MRNIKSILVLILLLISVNFCVGHDIVAYFCQVNQNIENQTTKTSDSHKLVWIESSLEEDSLHCINFV